MKSLGVLPLSVCVITFAHAGFAADDLRLHCPGSGEATDVQNNTVVGRDSDHNRTTAVVQTHNTRPYDGVVELKIEKGDASIRIPPGMYPSLYVSDKSRWLKVTDIVINDREIKGEFKITILSKPDFRIDRVTGEITVSDPSVNFTGACEKVDTEAAPKF